MMNEADLHVQDSLTRTSRGGRWLGPARARMHVLLLAAAVALAGCATSHVDLEWINPEFAGRQKVEKILVVGLTRDTAARRLYEDELAKGLSARGVTALRSYELVQGVFAADTTAIILETARREGAGSILSSAVVGHEHYARAMIDEPPPPMYWHGVYDRWYRHYWPYLQYRTSVQIDTRYLVSTTLTDTASGTVRWSLRTHTDPSGMMARDVKEFAGVVLDRLGKGGQL